ncbi:hypothetical protein WMY93_012866 [Mugilogobius chulae]|uniref:TIMELESS-interacting protein n=1 Tax=Mugilogobius chulae TaxID=88201 RepID=A0AAW0P250_9GOBI
MEDDGLFDHSRIEDEPFDDLPPPQSPGQDQGDPFGDGENGEVSKLADVPEAKRKAVKRPQPKLDSNRLISDRGLPALRTLFSNVQFKGKGHERMENWAHRLFPKLQFEDLSTKWSDSEPRRKCRRGGDPRRCTDFRRSGSVRWRASERDSLRLVHSTPAPSASVASHDLDLSLGSPPPSAPSLPSLTEEQRRRMEENRLKALERRLAKQKQQQEESQSEESQPTQSEPGESQTRESESVPMEESTEVHSEPSQVLLKSRPDPRRRHHHTSSTSSNTTLSHRKTPHRTVRTMWSQPQSRKNRRDKSNPVPEPDENHEEEEQEAKDKTNHQMSSSV